jgi:hypothetical protein
MSAVVEDVQTKLAIYSDRHQNQLKLFDAYRSVQKIDPALGETGTLDIRAAACHLADIITNQLTEAAYRGEAEIACHFSYMQHNEEVLDLMEKYLMTANYGVKKYCPERDPLGKSSVYFVDLQHTHEYFYRLRLLGGNSRGKMSCKSLLLSLEKTTRVPVDQRQLLDNIFREWSSKNKYMLNLITELNMVIIASTITLIDAHVFLDQLIKAGLTAHFNGSIRPPMETSDYHDFLSKCQICEECGDWSPSFKHWLREAARKGRSYPNLIGLKINNLRLILEPEDIQHLRNVFPSLHRLEYVDHGDAGDDYERSPVTWDHLRSVFPENVLEPFDT